MKKKLLMIFVLLICFFLFPGFVYMCDTRDQLAAPKTIIYHIGKNKIKITKGEQFNSIVNLINQRLKGANIITNGMWDYSLTDYLPGVDAIEFDYAHLQELNFKYIGDIELPCNGERPANPRTEIEFTKLIFPLSDKKNEGPNEGLGDKFSLSIFSYGDPQLSTGGQYTVMQLYPIDSPDNLIAYLKKR